MSSNVKKASLLAIGALLALNNVASAGLFGRSNNDKQEEERIPKPCPVVKGGDNVFLIGEFLYWQAHENGLGYAIKAEADEFNASPGIIDGKVKNPHFDWDPGYRVGIGYNLPHDQKWEIWADYLSFYTKAHGRKHVDADDDDVLIPIGISQSQQQSTQIIQVEPSNPIVVPAGRAPASTLVDATVFQRNPVEQPVFGPALAGTVTEAEAHWRLNLNQIDLQIGNHLRLTDWLSIKPHGGLRSAWIHQLFKTEYSGGMNISTDHNKVKNEYWGIGLVAGLDTQFNMSCHWSFYLDAALSLLYGFFHITEREVADDTLKFKLSDKYHVSRAITDLGFGLRWSYLFGNKHWYRISFQAGWEHHMYFGQNQRDELITSNVGISNSLLLSNKGDLTLQGGTVGGRFDF